MNVSRKYKYNWIMDLKKLCYRIKWTISYRLLADIASWTSKIMLHTSTDLFFPSRPPYHQLCPCLFRWCAFVGKFEAWMFFADVQIQRSIRPINDRLMTNQTHWLTHMSSGTEQPDTYESAAPVLRVFLASFSSEQILIEPEDEAVLPILIAHTAWVSSQEFPFLAWLLVTNKR